ncbi:hypothetical protein NDU88_002608 [Pleurodeles waltl]|uniref:Uncharacterized protein n=1 Tax=Pleurodeles waltl TaxID=8319 RepID=A0AAV7MXX9_PLEWA|nr:hypothetical protein NDU88_002608 [Pleurodeles waltl]
MDPKIPDLAAESCSIQTDIAGFHDRVTGMEQRLMTMEEKFNNMPDKTKNSSTSGTRPTDLEDRSHRNNVRFFGFPEQAESIDHKAFLQSILPTLTGFTLSLLLEFQWAHSMGFTGKN